eukprot:6187519-Pleurochrysis_carterae.AAC.4
MRARPCACVRARELARARVRVLVHMRHEVPRAFQPCFCTCCRVPTRGGDLRVLRFPSTKRLDAAARPTRKVTRNAARWPRHQRLHLSALFLLRVVPVDHVVRTRDVEEYLIIHALEANCAGRG